jgi:tetratricopeptide (TPR) repeat protein
MLKKDYATARDLLESALVAMRANGDRKFVAEGLLRLASVYDGLGHTLVATRTYDEAISAAELASDRARKVLALDNLGGIAYREKRFEDAQRFWSTGLQISTDLRDLWGQARLSFYPAMVLLNGGQVAAARELLIKSKTIYNRIGRIDKAHVVAEFLAQLDGAGTSPDQKGNEPPGEP